MDLHRKPRKLSLRLLLYPDGECYGMAHSETPKTEKLQFHNPHPLDSMAFTELLFSNMELVAGEEWEQQKVCQIYFPAIEGLTQCDTLPIPTTWSFMPQSSNLKRISGKHIYGCLMRILKTTENNFLPQSVGIHFVWNKTQNSVQQDLNW